MLLSLPSYRPRTRPRRRRPMPSRERSSTHGRAHLGCDRVESRRGRKCVLHIGRVKANDKQAGAEGQLDSDLIAELEIDRGLAAPHADIFARDLLQNDPHIAWRNAKWLEVPNDRLVERAFDRE